MTDEDVEKVARAIEAQLFRVQELGTGRGIVTPEGIARAALDASPVSRLESEVERLRNENDVLRDARLADENLALWKRSAEVASSERDQLAVEVAGLRRLVQAAITGLREWYGTDVFHGVESDCPEIAALVDALSSPKEERR